MKTSNTRQTIVLSASLVVAVLILMLIVAGVVPVGG